MTRDLSALILMLALLNRARTLTAPSATEGKGH